VTSGQSALVPAPLDNDLIELLVQRDGLTTEVVLRDSRTLSVRNIAWGYDEGDAYAHVTTNISPSAPVAIIDLFFTNEVATVVDPLTGSYSSNLRGESPELPLTQTI
jgi:hypothetical protein